MSGSVELLYPYLYVELFASRDRLLFWVKPATIVDYFTIPAAVVEFVIISDTIASAGAPAKHCLLNRSINQSINQHLPSQPL